MSKTFHRVRNLHPARSVFNLTYEKKFTADMGQLIPVMCDEVVPGDVFKIGSQAVIRFQPLVAPIMHEISMTVHYIFCPYRLLWDDWETFITGGPDGDDDTPIPTWSPTPVTGNAKNTLWDYLGFPVGVIPTGALPWISPEERIISSGTRIIAMRIYRMKSLKQMNQYLIGAGLKTILLQPSLGNSVVRLQRCQYLVLLVRIGLWLQLQVVVRNLRT